MKRITLILSAIIITSSIYAQIDIRRLYDMAQMASEMEHWNDAIKYYDKIIQTTPYDSFAYYKIAEAYVNKGHDADNATTAMYYFKKYQELDPEGARQKDIDTILNRLEYLISKSEKQTAIIDNFKGKWITTDWRIGDQVPTAMITISDQVGRMRITLDHQSSIYNDCFISDVAVVNVPSNKCIFAFGSDKRYNPSSASYDAMRILGNMVAGSISNSTASAIVSAATNIAVNAAQEKDIATSTMTTYMFTVDIKPTERGTIIGTLEISGEHNSQNGQKQTNEFKTLEFEKLPDDFILPPLLTKSDIKASFDSKESFMQTGSIIRHYAGEDAYKKYLQSRKFKNAATGLVITGGTLYIAGIIFTAVGFGVGFDEMGITGTVCMGTGVISAGTGGILFGESSSRRKKCLNMYNQNRRDYLGKQAMQLSIGQGKYGVGAVLNF